MKQQVKRITISGTAFNEITFSTICGKWLVKNFGTDPIYVSFDSTADTDETIKIKGGYYQTIVANEFGGGIDAYKSTKIYVRNDSL